MMYIEMCRIRTIVFSLVLAVTLGVLPRLGAAEPRTVKESIRLAIHQHPEVLARRVQQGIEQQELKYLEAEFLPKLTLALGVGREDSNNASTRADNGRGSEEMERRESSLTLSQMLFDGFKTHWQTKSQQAQMEALSFELRNLMSEVALRAVQSHLDVARANLAFSDNIRNLEAHEKIAEDVSQRVRSGKDNRAKINQIRSRLSLSMANVEAARQQVLDAGAEYVQNVGEAPERALSFQEGLISLPDSLAAFWESANQHNASILAALSSQKAARNFSRAAESGDYPSLYLQSGASWNANMDGIEGRNSDAFVMFRMQYDLYQGGADKARQRQARLQIEQSQWELAALRRDLRRDVEQVWHQYQSGSRRIRLLQDYVESAEQTKIAYEKQFDIGQRNLIDLLDAENEVLSARKLLTDARKALYYAKYQILHLQGNLLAQDGTQALEMTP